MSKLSNIFSGFLLLLGISPALCVAGEKWDFVIAPYALLPNITGDIGGFGIASDFTWNLQGFGNVEKPEGGPEWSLQFAVKFLFPK